MPAIYFHYLTCDLLMDKKAPYRNIILLGSQGPDPLFFYGHSLAIRVNQQEKRAMGDKFHHEKIAETMQAMMEYASREEKEQNRNILYSYISGYFFHYCVDRNCHPYIFYRSGFTTTKDENQLKYKYFHASFESELDVAISKRYKFNRTIPSRLILCSNRNLMLISKMYYFVTQKVYYPCNYFGRTTFYHAVKDMRFAYRFTYSPFKVKKAVFERRAKYRLRNAISHPFYIDENIDHLNLKRSSWRDPVSGAYNDLSVIDMIENAKREYEQTVTLREIKDKKIRDSYILRFVHDTDFDGEKIGSTKQYYSLYKEDYKNDNLNS